VVVDVPVALYVPAACGDAGGASVVYTGLGDFPQPSQAAETVQLGSTGSPLAALPPATREIVLGPLTDAGPWAGEALVPDAGPVSVLTLPQGRACPLSRPVNLAGDPGVAVGMLDPSHALLVGGDLPPFVIDLGHGSVTATSAAMTPPRDGATVTPFGGGGLIAGGQDPTTGETQATAIVFTPGVGSGAGSFGSPIVLPAGQRKQHGAVTLVDGRTLLVGGVSDTGAMVTTIEALDPAHPGVVAAVAGTLRQPRVRPAVLALPTGQVFIGGGFAADGTPVASVEWLAPDLTWLGTAALCGAGTEQGFAATEGGAVLVVMGPAPATAACSNVHLALPTSILEAPPLAPPPLRVRLFPGPSASPVLVTDQATLRWNPWTTAFTPLGSNAAGLSLPTSAAWSASPGLALWLGEDSQVWALRFDTRGAYATDVGHGPYLVTDSLFTAPDRLPGADVSFSVQGGASLSGGASVWVTDATFVGVTASVVLPQGGAVDVVLRAPAGGELTCQAHGVPVLGTVEVVRTGASATVSVAGGSPVPCPGQLDPKARVAVGFRGPPPGGGTSTLREVTLLR